MDSPGFIGFRSGAIAELMEREALSLSSFARRVRVSRQRVHGWTTRAISPQFPMILRMCAEFGVAPKFFAEGLADPESPAPLETTEVTP